MSLQLARSGAAVGGSVGATIAIIIIGLLIFAILTLRRRRRGGK